ncbi:MAG: hypothetical protein C0482_00420 [Gordonia sp.]|uniref:DNA-binding protein n=2 Tax=Mycobacteriales TaxID=85007 RepID=A0ABT4MUG1_GORRU|nr:hypothetical protein [Williamsia sp. 1138]MBA4020806.1 hypothetical protein [Gordonia sp. (in: high G+C Gram-positive bacteria)]MCZ4550638.1 hypothetical protein [Gordonia rubripertincta]OZG28524.1 hypothetical protein BH683_014165 [Williamsia sp. 1138]
MYVMTTDQQQSRRNIDRLPEAFDALSHVPTIRSFDRTAGDEFQAVLDSAEAVTAAVIILAELGHWSIGIGIGDVERPLPDQTRAGRGTAFERARTAVTEAKRIPHPVAVVGTDPDTVSAAQTAQRLLALVVGERSEAGHAAVREMRRHRTQSEAAATLGVTPQAMSQRLRAANWYLEEDTRMLATRLLAAAR